MQTEHTNNSSQNEQHLRFRNDYVFRSQIKWEINSEYVFSLNREKIARSRSGEQPDRSLKH